MTEDSAPYDDGTIECAAKGCKTRFVPRNDEHRSCSGACRARRSRQRAAEGPEPGKVTGCRITKEGNVSVTVHLPPDQQDRIAELQPGRWAHVTPHGSH